MVGCVGQLHCELWLGGWMAGWIGESVSGWVRILFFLTLKLLEQVHTSLADPTFPSVERTVKPLPDFSQVAFKTLSIHSAYSAPDTESY